jgi:2-methylisocitrate lyase-like PEP mutase family enzyme
MATLRERIDKGILAPGVYDGVSAALATAQGFDALYLPGTAVEASAVGAPDIGMMTMSELVDRARLIVGVSDTPLICDADTGFGGVTSIQRTVRDLERAGAAAVQIEDQVNPKRCPAIAGARRVLPVEEARDRVAAAVDARRSEEFLIIARSDADIESASEQIKRCNAYREAGADVTFPLLEEWDGQRFLGLAPDEQMRIYERLRREIDGPIATVFTPKGHTGADLHQIGIAVVLAPTILRAIATTFMNFYTSIANSGSDEEFFDRFPPRPATTVELFGLLGLDGYLAADERFSRG